MILMIPIQHSEAHHYKVIHNNFELNQAYCHKFWYKIRARGMQLENVQYSIPFFLMSQSATSQRQIKVSHPTLFQTTYPNPPMYTPNQPSIPSLSLDGTLRSPSPRPPTSQG